MPLPPLILFGAFDRHNFGDLLFAHVAARLLADARPDRQPIFAGLAARDMRAYGGHEVVALSALAQSSRDERVTVLHVGGELPACTAWDAAVMLAPPGQAQTLFARHGAHADTRAAYARATLGVDAQAPYIVGRETFPLAAHIGFMAIGGASLDTCDPATRDEALTKLRAADFLTVRDIRTQGILRDAGIGAPLMRDPVSAIRALFDERIRMHAERGEPARVRRAFPDGYLAVQFSADFGDDATLVRLAARLRDTARHIVLFRAGAAPWHDDLAVYERLAHHMRQANVTIFESLNIWDICALIVHSAGYLGSSLHGRIVAMAYDLPRETLARPDSAKQLAYAQTWDDADRSPAAVPYMKAFDAL
jgi:hypothetical protein